MNGWTQEHDARCEQIAARYRGQLTDDQITAAAENAEKYNAEPEGWLSDFDAGCEAQITQGGER